MAPLESSSGAHAAVSVLLWDHLRLHSTGVLPNEQPYFVSFDARGPHFYR